MHACNAYFYKKNPVQHDSTAESTIAGYL